MLDRVYFDACCFIELAKGERGHALQDDGKHVWSLQALLRASKAGLIQVCTSTISVAECVALENDMGPEVQRLFTGLLTSGKGGVLLLQDDIWTVERARDIRWKNGVTLRSPDSIHVAAALQAGCKELLTLDGNSPEPKRRSILKSAPAFAPLGLRVVVPLETLMIPDEMRQPGLPYEVR